jgi:hypothetical protein
MYGRVGLDILLLAVVDGMYGHVGLDILLRAVVD